jgi:hypothetical protein
MPEHTVGDHGPRQQDQAAPSPGEACDLEGFQERIHDAIRTARREVGVHAELVYAQLGIRTFVGGDANDQVAAHSDNPAALGQPSAARRGQPPTSKQAFEVCSGQRSVLGAQHAEMDR